MKSRRILLAIAAGLVPVFATVAFAAASCSVWLKQADGTEWRTCVDDAGRQYCESKATDGTISRVSCTK